MEAGRREKKWFFLKTIACVCDEWRGSARIGCWCKREVEKMSKTSMLCRKAMKKKILKTKKLSLLGNFELLPLEVDIRAISNVVFFAPLSISSILRVFISIREKFCFSNNEMPFFGG